SLKVRGVRDRLGGASDGHLRQALQQAAFTPHPLPPSLSKHSPMARNVEAGQRSLPLRPWFPTSIFYVIDSSVHSRFVLRILIFRVSAPSASANRPPRSRLEMRGARMRDGKGMNVSRKIALIPHITKGLTPCSSFAQK